MTFPGVSSKFADVDGITTHYLEAGSGNNFVVLLHGGEFGCCAELSWESLIGSIAEHFHVIAPDWLGFGRTDKIHDFVSGQHRRMMHMRRFLDVAGIKRAHFAGNSMGGSQLAKCQAQDPPFFLAKSLVLISGGGFAPLNEWRKRLLDYDCTKEGMREILRALFFDPKWAEDDDYLERRHQLSLIPGAWECSAAARLKSPASATRSEFGNTDDTPYERIASPALLIAGADDRLRLPGYANEIARRIPRSELQVLGECGHCPNIEKAAEVSRLMIDFFCRVDREST
jgi:pimeloyl-ACP methyl ester carboxylesterase